VADDQAQVAPDFRPLPLAIRTLKQLRRHVRPAVQLPPTSRSWAAPAAFAVLLVGFGAAARGSREPRERPAAGPKVLLVGAGLGLLWAGTSYLPFVLSPLTHGAERQQFLSGPGVALLLASIVGGLVYWLPARVRPAATLLLGGWISLAEFVLGVYPPRLHITAHAHLLLVGFMLMIVMGVATWMFPRPARDDTRYRPGLAEAVYWMMTLSTVVRAAAEILAPLSDTPALRWAVALGGLGQLVGAGLFVLNMWPRIRMPGA